MLGSGVGGGGGGKAGAQRRTEELQAKVMKQAEELVELHRKRGEAQTALAELTTQLRQKDDDLVKKDGRCVAYVIVELVKGCWQDKGGVWSAEEAGSGARGSQKGAG